MMGPFSVREAPVSLVFAVADFLTDEPSRFLADSTPPDRLPILLVPAVGLVERLRVVPRPFDDEPDSIC